MSERRHSSSSQPRLPAWVTLFLFATLAVRFLVVAGMVAFLGWLLYTQFQKDFAQGLFVVVVTCGIGGVATYVGVRLGLKYRRQSERSLEEYRRRKRAGYHSEGDSASDRSQK